MSGRLTTHVLDTGRGRPAANVQIDLTVGSGSKRTVRTDVDGRAALLSGDEMQSGECELVFHVGDYFAALGDAGGESRFLDRVPVRFNISDANAHYHVPLLVTPWAYSTYRGS